MEDVRKIIREEIAIVINERGLMNFEKHPIFSNPTKAAEYAMDWMQKASDLNRFYWQVSNILGTSDMAPEEKLARIQELMPHYGWL